MQSYYDTVIKWLNDNPAISEFVHNCIIIMITYQQCKIFARLQNNGKNQQFLTVV